MVAAPELRAVLPRATGARQPSARVLLGLPRCRGAFERGGPSSFILPDNFLGDCLVVVLAPTRPSRWPARYSARPAQCEVAAAASLLKRCATPRVVGTDRGLVKECRRGRNACCQVHAAALCSRLEQRGAGGRHSCRRAPAASPTHGERIVPQPQVQLTRVVWRLWRRRADGADADAAHRGRCAAATGLITTRRHSWSRRPSRRIPLRWLCYSQGCRA